MNWIVARLLCEDGSTIEVAGNAFQVKGAIANAAISAAPLSEGFLGLSSRVSECGSVL